MNKSLFLKAYSVVLPLALPLPSLAADGVVEINQACALTGCFPGDSPGFPITISAEGSYLLTSELVAPPATTGIEIEGSRVTLDLNGFTLRGGYQCINDPPDCEGDFSYGIRGTGNNSTVVNGTITAFGVAGLQLNHFARVDGVQVSFTGGDGIKIGAVSQVRNSIVRSVRFDGIGIDSGLVQDNVVVYALGDGIEVVLQANVRGNFVVNSAESDGEFTANTGYALNYFGNPPTGGVSVGNNVCGTAAC